MEEIIILELFSGIGGMHQAFKRSLKKGTVKAAVDINQNANKTYQHNFQSTLCLSRNIQKMNLNKYQHVNVLLMSPPCQPFTRNGNMNDSDDNRCEALLTICDWIKESKLRNLKYILMENVMGFEKSRMREEFIETLKLAGFYYQEFIITPTQLGIPNTRHRYYCIARKYLEFSFKNYRILNILPDCPESHNTEMLSSFLDDNESDEYLLSDDLLNKRFQVLDIQTPHSKNTMCFTKAYTRYIEGTGSVLSTSQLELNELKEKLNVIDSTDGDNLDLKKALKLRFFTPTEVARLMAFPNDFSFPPSVNTKQKYKLLGNSINVAVVSELIKLLIP